MLRPRSNAGGGAASLEVVLQPVVLHCSVWPSTSYTEGTVNTNVVLDEFSQPRNHEWDTSIKWPLCVEP
jgi:hypothetical protein